MPLVNRTFDQLINFTRTTAATFVGSNGLIQTTPQSRNLLTFTEEFDNAAWTKTDTQVVPNVNPAAASLGAELVTNGDFSGGATGWTPGPDWSISAGAASKVSGASAENLSQTVPLTAGMLVRITYTVTAISGVVFPRLNGTANVDGLQRTATGVYTDYLVVPAGYTSFAIRANSTTTVTVDNISVQQVVGGALLAPDGTFTADTLIEGSAGTGQVGATGSVSAAGATATFSIYLKRGNTDWVRLQVVNGANGFRAWFNLATGAAGSTAAVGTGTVTGASIVNAGNGWYRCIVTGAIPSVTAYSVFTNTASADSSGTRVSGGTYLAWGAQLEQASTATDYTRNFGGLFPPRFDYDPVTLAPRGLLVEEQRTNRTLQSEDFTAAAWVAATSGTSTRVNDGAPLGFTRGLITATSANGGIRQVHSGLTSGQVYALSFYIQSTATSVQIVFENGTAQFGSPHNVTINPSNGTAGVLTGFTSVSIQPFGPGYVYTLITAPAGGALAANIEWRITNSGNSIWLGRPQFEAGAFATSYIPTVASQVTRTADIAAIAAPNFASWYNQTEGTFVATGSSFGGAVSGLYEASASGASAQSISVRLGQRFSFAQNLNRFDFSYTTGNTINHAFAYSASNYGAAVGGTNLTVNANGQPTSVPAGANQLALGYLGSSAFMLNGHIRSIRYYPTRLSNAQLQALTA